MNEFMVDVAVHLLPASQSKSIFLRTSQGYGIVEKESKHAFVARQNWYTVEVTLNNFKLQKWFGTTDYNRS